MSWDTTTGFIEHFTGTVVDAWFATDVEYNPDALQLYLKFADIESEEVSASEVPDEFTRNYTCGDGWETIDDGKSARRIDGTEKPFHQNSGVGLLINRIIGKTKRDQPYQEDLKGAAEALKASGDPAEASTWVGHRFTMAPEEFSFTSRDTGEEVTYTRTLPVAYHGEGGGGEVAAKESAPAVDNGKVLEAKLTALAKQSDSPEAFISAALEVDGVTDDPDLFGRVADDSDTGFYAQVTS